MPNPNALKEIQDFKDFISLKFPALKDLIQRESSAASLTEYIAELDVISSLKDYIVTAEEFKILAIDANNNNWESKKAKTKELLTKFKENKIQLIQSRDGEWHFKLQFNNDVERRLYKGTWDHDYSLAIVVAPIFNKYISKYNLNDQQKELLLAALIDGADPHRRDGIKPPILFMNERSDESFSALYKFTIKEKNKSLSEDEWRVLNNFVDDFTSEVRKDFSQLKVKDKDILGAPKIHPKAIVKSESKNKPEGSKPRATLITTSNSGNAHGIIANNLQQESIATMDRSSVIINESFLYMDDVLSRFVGIPFCETYTKIAQQMQQLEYRDLLSLVERNLLDFSFDNRPALFRHAIGLAQEDFVLSSMCCVSHYDTNVRFRPETAASLTFQFCDLQVVPYIMKGLAKTVSQLEMLRVDSDIRFFVPLQVDLGNTSQSLLYNSSFQRLAVISDAPIVKLSTDESETLFSRVAENLKLDTKDNNLIHVVIAMGGYGCKDAIIANVDKLLAEIRETNPNANFEIIATCGNNKALKEELEEKYKNIGLDNVSIKFAGYIENKSFVALCMNSILVTKPGGATAYECLYNNIPALLIYNPDFPWEKTNIDALIQANLGRRIDGDNVDRLPFIGELVELKKQVKVAQPQSDKMPSSFLATSSGAAHVQDRSRRHDSFADHHGLFSPDLAPSAEDVQRIQQSRPGPGKKPTSSG